MIHSLHHVLVPLMPPAIEEALRCLKPGAALIVVEPPPEGSFHEVFKLIDDETAIRNEAQAALDAACRDGILQRDSSRTWQVVEAFADVDELIRNVAAVDPLRRKRADAIRDEITQSLKVHGKPGPEGYTLLHKVQADVFRRA